MIKEIGHYACSNYFDILIFKSRAEIGIGIESLLVKAYSKYCCNFKGLTSYIVQ